MWSFDGWTPSTPTATRRSQLDLGTLRDLASIVTAETPGADIAVFEVPALPEPTPVAPELECDPAVATGLCAGAGLRVLTETIGDSIVIRLRQAIGEGAIELLPGPTVGTWRARMFYVFAQEDSLTGAYCLGGTSVAGAIPATGSVTLTSASFADPGQAHGVLELDLPDAVHVHLRF